MYMLVSHRNMISIFDMTGTQEEGGHWVDTYSFAQGKIRKMLIKKRSKKDRLDLLHNKMESRNASIRTPHTYASEQVLSIFDKY